MLRCTPVQLKKKINDCANFKSLSRDFITNKKLAELIVCWCLTDDCAGVRAEVLLSGYALYPMQL